VTCVYVTLINVSYIHHYRNDAGDEKKETVLILAPKRCCKVLARIVMAQQVLRPNHYRECFEERVDFES
jgi:hypothetical protein